MTDIIRERLAVFDRVDVPDLWTEVQQREPREPWERGPSRVRRVVVAVFALGIAAASFLFMVHEFRSIRRERPAATSVTNGLLAFRADNTGWLVDPDGTDLRPIPHPENVATITPLEWSPDGTRLVFYGYLKGEAGSGGADYSIFVSEADGSHLRSLTSSLGGAEGEESQGNPRWSPDGSRIVFENDGSDRTLRGLFVMNADGTEMLKVADGGYPTWSPDGSRLAFIAVGPGGRTDIYSVAVDGTELINLTSSPHRYEGLPAWSPDGSKIAFVSSFDGESQVFVMEADGSEPRVVSTVENEGVGGYSPSWSPDGNTIAFEVYHNQDWDIFLVDADGAGQTQLTDGLGDEHRPVWSPDGLKVAFMQSPFGSDHFGPTDGTFDVYTIDRDGSGEVRLTQDIGGSAGSLTWGSIQTNANGSAIT